MTFTIEELKTDVMRRLGIVLRPLPDTAETSYAGDSDIIDGQIRSLVPSLGATLIAEAPLHLLGDAECILPRVEFVTLPCGMKGAQAEIEPDVIRIVSVKMKSWDRECREVIMPGDPRAAMRRSREVGISGCPESPKCYLEGGATSRRTLLCGSRDASDTLEWFWVWKRPSFTADGRFHFPVLLYPQLLDGIISILNEI